MSDDNVAVLRPTDEELARGFKARIIAASDPICKIIDEARQAGLILNFAFNINSFGKSELQGLTVIKYIG